MKIKDDLLRSFTAAGVSILVLLAGGFMAAAETGIPAASGSVVTQTASPTSTALPPTRTYTPEFTSTQTSTPTITLTFTPSLTYTITQTPTATACPVPEGWEPYTVKAKDTLKTLAKKRKTTVDAILKGNCLSTNKLAAGMQLYLPSINTATPTTAACKLPQGWFKYTIQENDSLVGLADLLGVTVRELQAANCMTEDAGLNPGTVIFLPLDPANLPTRTPGAIPTVVPQPITTQDG